MENGNLHFVMFPWLAIGHLIPFLHLSRSLAERGHRVSFISTPKNLQRLPQIPSNCANLIDLISIPLPRVENLPDHAESSMDIPHNKAQFLKIAFDLLQSPFATFLLKTNPKPDWIIYDYASHWMPELASNFGIPTSFFSLFNAANLAFIGPPSIILSGEVVRSKAEDFAVVPKWFPFPSNIAYRVHEVLKYVDGSAGNNESGTDDATRFGVSVDACDIVLVRTSMDFEPEYFNLLCELYKKPIFSLGFLPPLVEDDNNSTWTEIKDWLDNQKDSSVVYVALGTEATLDHKEMELLALGLEQCGLPFFWVLRKPPGSTADVSEMLPEGYEERIKRCGVVYKEWVPQVKILGHPAIGGFLTHCGWNSVIEALSLGRVLILFPVMNDQGLNARLLQEKNIGVEIPRNEKDGSFTSYSVADSIRLAMTGQDGESIRKNAMEMRNLFRDQLRHNSLVDDYVRHLVERNSNTQKTIIPPKLDCSLIGKEMK